MSKFSILYSSKPRQRGATLIEVLVTVLLVSLGLMALTGMQMFALGANKNSLQRGVAALLASEFTEMMRANPSGFKHYDTGAFSYTASFSAYVLDSSKICAYPSCNTPQKIADNDIQLMRQRARSQLLGGQIHLDNTNDKFASLWVLWEEAAVQANVKDNSGTEVSTEENIDSCPSGITTVPRPRCLFIRVNL